MNERGLDVRGVDLSPQMVATACSAHPHLTFQVASMTKLPVTDVLIVGAVLWFSTIHTPSAFLHEVWEELSRVVIPGGRVLLGFQTGNGNEVQRETRTVRRRQ